MNSQQQAKETNKGLTAMWRDRIETPSGLKALDRHLANLQKTFDEIAENRKEYRKLVQDRIDELEKLLA